MGKRVQFKINRRGVDQIGEATTKATQEAYAEVVQSHSDRNASSVREALNAAAASRGLTIKWTDDAVNRITRGNKA